MGVFEEGNHAIGLFKTYQELASTSINMYKSILVSNLVSSFAMTHVQVLTCID